MKHYLFILCFISSWKSIAQNAVLSSKDSLFFWGDAMISMRDQQFRNISAERFNDLWYRQVNSLSDTNLLNFHPSIIKVNSADGQLRIYTWARETHQGTNQYYACIFYKEEKPLCLVSKPRNYQRINYDDFTHRDWYGALYYHIVPDTFDGRYLLLGFCQSPDGTKHRIIEPLQVDQGTCHFGRDLFIKENEKREKESFHRIVLHYSPSAQVAIRYEQEPKQFMFDHIEHVIDPKSGETLKIPDGTFEAYIWMENKFEHIDYLKNTPMDTAPVEKPVFGPDSKQRDIFGRKKN